MLDHLTWFKQAAFRWAGDDMTVYIDPWGVPDDAPPADAIFITHAHDDHFRPEEIERLRTPDTAIVAPYDIARELAGNVQPVAPGDVVDAAGVKALAVPAYNVVEERLAKHPRERGWVGYMLELDGTSYYHAGDTDHLPELESLGPDVAFLPIGGTFTMDPSEAAALARAMSPGVAVPMHYGYIVGSPSDADRFRSEASPVPVEVLTPVQTFERA